MFLVSLVYLPWMRGFLDDLYHYHAVVNSVQDVGPAQSYLEHFPQGRHRASVETLLDDRLFAIAASDKHYALALLRNAIVGAIHDAEDHIIIQLR